MAKKALKDLNEKELSLILDNFGRTKTIFQSEAQFQFKLAWELNKQFDCNVKLEELTIDITNGAQRKQKIYTDIVLEKGDYRVAIELKYKTAELVYKDILLFDHGAVDLGRYDYLWDVNRLELLVNSALKIPVEEQIDKENDIPKRLYNVRKPCNKGFAILLTNDEKYWKQYWDKMIPPTTAVMDNQFKIGEDSSLRTHIGQLYGTRLDWRHYFPGLPYPKYYPKTIQHCLARARRIELKHIYKYEWKEYCTLLTSKECKEKREFKYVIISV